MKKSSIFGKILHLENMMNMEDIMIEPILDRRAKSSSDPFNPNVPFEVTQEEFLEHIWRIEAGNFMTLDEFKTKHEVWKKNFLASMLK